MMRTSLLPLLGVVFSFAIADSLIVPRVGAQTLSASETARYIRAVRQNADNVEKQIALRALRDGRPEPTVVVVVPALVELLEGARADDVSVRNEGDLTRRLAMEVLAEMSGPSLESTLPLLVKIAVDADEHGELAAQAAITIAALHPTGMSARKVALALSGVLNRREIPTHVFQEACNTIGKMGFEARGALGDLLKTLENESADLDCYTPAADAFEKIAVALKERGDVLDPRELLRIDGQLTRGLLALKRNGADGSMKSARAVDETLQALRKEEEQHRHLFSLVRRIGSEGVYYLSLGVCLGGIWVVSLAVMGRWWPSALRGVKNGLSILVIEKIPLFGVSLRSPLQVGELLNTLLLVNYFARRTAVRSGAISKPHPQKNEKDSLP